MDVNKSLLENENKIYENESKIKIFNIYDEIEKISGKSDENKNLYQEIIKLTKLYEDCLIELDLIKKKSLEDNNKNVFVDNSLELKLQYEKILEIKKIEFNVEHEKLKLCFEERKNAAQYHKRNFNKIFFENELLRKKFKTAFDDIKKLDKNVEIDKNQKDLQIDLENYRKLLRCTACDKNYKNTILLRCMHVFCKECVDERIKTRNRNCPNCNEHFISAEVKKIYL
ncbi:E3 ubiquitin-protein ligase bre1 [Gurleya vavrai]